MSEDSSPPLGTTSRFTLCFCLRIATTCAGTARCVAADTEIHIIPHANPDGRIYLERGGEKTLWKKSKSSGNDAWQHAVPLAMRARSVRRCDCRSLAPLGANVAVREGRELARRRAQPLSPSPAPALQTVTTTGIAPTGGTESIRTETSRSCGGAATGRTGRNAAPAARTARPSFTAASARAASMRPRPSCKEIMPLLRPAVPRRLSPSHATAPTLTRETASTRPPFSQHSSGREGSTSPLRILTCLSPPTVKACSSTCTHTDD